MVESKSSVFWEDLDRDLEDPEFYRYFVLEQNRINTTDRIVNDLLSALAESGLSRADVARVVNSHSSAIRRLLNSGTEGTNPTLNTLSDVAAVLGFQVELVPMKQPMRTQITKRLRNVALSQSKQTPTKPGQRKISSAA